MILYGTNYCTGCNQPFDEIGNHCDDCIMLEAVGQ